MMLCRRLIFCLCVIPYHANKSWFAVERGWTAGAKEGAAEAAKPNRLGTTMVSPSTLNNAGWKSSVPASLAFQANRD